MEPERFDSARLLQRMDGRDFCLGIIGLGYVGVPLALAAANASIRVLGFDINAARVEGLNSGRSMFRHIPDQRMQDAIAAGNFEATSDFARLGEPDAIVIAVPTPLTRNREPDLSFVEATARSIAACLRPGQLIVLESTTWPGTTMEVLKPILDRTGLVSGRDYFLAFSPEREDPGNKSFSTADIPKVVGGDGPLALQLATALYAKMVIHVVPVSSTAAAEAVKLTENIFRSVNIALVNELKLIYDAMGIDIWEVIDAAKTKPFGFMPFYPGPGLGGHCIPIDPFYLSWRAREFGLTTRFIELAGEINTFMPHHVVARMAEALDRQQGKGLNGAKLLVIGVAYKKNIDDMRESPALVLIELLQKRGAIMVFHDPLVDIIPPTREHAALAGLRSMDLDAGLVGGQDGVLIATDHDDIDYELLHRHARLIVDTRNAMGARGITSAHVIKA
ncbi:WecC UDP-N-acetyl-D-mannosaminuronate dehydrogenase [Rhabdaerophilaceae bacterium]